MKALGAAYWLGVWLLSPSRGALVLKCLFIGLVLKLLSLVLLLPLALLPASDDADAGPAAPDGWQSAIGMTEAMLLAPLIETALMALVFAASDRLFGERPWVPLAAIVAGAVALHPGDWFTHVFVAFMFAAMSIQFARFRTLLGYGPAILCVAVTHGTVNMLGIAVGLASAGP